MKLLSLTLTALFGSALSAPAIVWKNGDQHEVVHSSDEKNVSDLISELESSMNDKSSLDAAVFVVGKSAEGDETLSKLTSSGSLPGVASKYDEASIVHSHVAGVKSAGEVARACNKSSKKNVVEVTLDEFNSKMGSLGQDGDSTETSDKKAVHRAKKLSRANIMIVNIPASVEPSKVDETVVHAVEHKLINSVVLAGQRSNREIRFEREAEKERKLAKQRQQKLDSRRRRLEDGNNNGGGNSNTLEFYVPMTPNIFAGIIFTLFFAVVTWTGLMQMNMIQGQDVYVSKYPTIGREA